MKPFANDITSITVGDLAAENGADAVTLSGSLEITRDKTGLKRAQTLKALADITNVMMAALRCSDARPFVGRCGPKIFYNPEAREAGPNS
jgi:hypothetical protein